MRHYVVVALGFQTMIASHSASATEITTALLASHKGWCYSELMRRPGTIPSNTDPRPPATERFTLTAESALGGNFTRAHFNPNRKALVPWQAGSYTLFTFPGGHLAIQILINQSAMGHNTGFIRTEQVEIDDSTGHIIFIANNNDNMGARYELVPCDDENHIPQASTLPPMRWPETTP